MKYEPQVESIFKKFIQTPGANQFNEFQLEHIKRYLQKAWETGYAQGYADSMYDQNKDTENYLDSDYYDNGHDTRTSDNWMDNVLDLSNN